MAFDQIIERFAIDKPDSIALIDAEKAISYQNLKSTINQLSSQLTKMIQGEVVGILSSNSVDIIITYLACFKVGKIIIPMSSKLQTEEIEYILKQTKPAIFVSSTEFIDKLNGINWEQYKVKIILLGEQNK